MKTYGIAFGITASFVEDNEIVPAIVKVNIFDFGSSTHEVKFTKERKETFIRLINEELSKYTKE